MMYYINEPYMLLIVINGDKCFWLCPEDENDRWTPCNWNEVRQKQSRIVDLKWVKLRGYDKHIAQIIW